MGKILMQDYQHLAARTLLEEPDGEYEHDEMMMIWNALGLAGEAGEVADHIKKGIFHKHGIDADKLKKEIGDTLWYLTAICTTWGFTLQEVMDLNIEKLQKRYPNGYNSEDSINRDKTDPKTIIAAEQEKLEQWIGARKILEALMDKYIPNLSNNMEQIPTGLFNIVRRFKMGERSDDLYLQIINYEMRRKMGEAAKEVAEARDKEAKNLGKVKKEHQEKLDEIDFNNGFRPELDWNEAYAHLMDTWEIYKELGVAGSFAIGAVFIPLKERYERGERTGWLWIDMMAVE